MKDYSRKGVVLFFCVFALGIALRLISAFYQSANLNHIAQIYYSQHLDQVFFLDSQTPFHYIVSSLVDGGSLQLVRFMTLLFEGLILSWCLIFVQQKKSHERAFMLFTASWLWPVNITSFELLPSLTLLIIVLWHVRPPLKPIAWWGILALIQLFQPVTLVFVLIFILADLIRKELSASQARFLVSTSLPVIIYYAVKLGTFGLANWKFPWPSLHYLIFLLPLCYLIFQKREVSVKAILGVLVVFLVYDFTILKPWITYPGDDEAVAAFKTYTAELYERPVVICATIPQQDYYFKLKQDCQFEVLKHQLAKQEFYYFDLSGTRSDLVGFLKKNAPHVEEKKFHHATFLSVTY